MLGTEDSVTLEHHAGYTRATRLPERSAIQRVPIAERGISVDDVQFDGRGRLVRVLERHDPVVPGELRLTTMRGRLRSAPRRAVFVGTVVAVATTLTLAGCAPQPEPDSTVEDLPIQLTQEERQNAIFDCLEELGWEIVDRSTGETNIPEEQLPQFQTDSENCIAGIDGSSEVIPLTQEQLTELYGLEVAAAECLSGMGYSVDVPTLQTYTDTYSTEPFIAHLAIGQLSPSEWEAATKKCPPPAWTYRP